MQKTLLEILFYGNATITIKEFSNACTFDRIFSQ